MLDGHTDARTDAQVILYSVQCYALHWTDNKTKVFAVAHSKDFVILACVVLTQYTSVTNRRTNGQTERRLYDS